MQPHCVVVVVLGGLGDRAGQVDGQPAREEGLHGQPVIRHGAAVDLLPQLAKLLNRLGASTARDLLTNSLTSGVVAERDSATPSIPVLVNGVLTIASPCAHAARACSSSLVTSRRVRLLESGANHRP